MYCLHLEQRLSMRISLKNSNDYYSLDSYNYNMKFILLVSNVPTRTFSEKELENENIFKY